MQVAITGKNSNVLQVDNLNIISHVEMDDLLPQIREVVEDLMKEQPEKGLTNLSIACLKLAGVVECEYVRSALLIAAQNANFVPESALVSMSIFEMLCEMKFSNQLDLKQYVDCFDVKIEKLLGFSGLPQGMNWLDNLYMTRMAYIYKGSILDKANMSRLLRDKVLKKFCGGINQMEWHNEWYSRPALRTISKWYDNIHVPFGLTLAGIALSRVYMEVRGVNPSEIEKY